MPELNPRHPEAKEITERMTHVDVSYIDMSGEVRDGVMEVHPNVAEDIAAFFEESVRLQFPIEYVTPSSTFEWDDDILMDKNITSSFNYRLIKGTDRPSLHGQGLAFDVNPRLNPYIRFVDGEAYVDPPGATLDPTVPGTIAEASHPLVVFMKERGWEWGGDWTEEQGAIDYQHFQKPSAED